MMPVPVHSIKVTALQDRQKVFKRWPDYQIQASSATYNNFNRQLICFL
jgi:hypothetical protein